MINVAIVGYGNIGRGVRQALLRNPDMKLTAVFSRRPEAVKKEVAGVPVLPLTGERPKDVPIDVVILCGGSKEDIPVQGPGFARSFSTVDSFDTHADIPAYFAKMDAAARQGGNVSIISAGWDPGIFSLERTLGDAFLPGRKGYTFWGPGVSQGHSDAARTVAGVQDARAYTLPVKEAIDQIRGGQTPELSKRAMHRRQVYVVPKEGADREAIREAIITMPKYFDEYDTEVVFITAEAMSRQHATYPHGGFVLTSGQTGRGHREILEYKCQLESNPEFTASVLVACARAATRLKAQQSYGAFTMLDFPLGLLSPHAGEALRRQFM